MNDKVFVKESYKILKGTAVFKDGSVDEVKNVYVYSKINVDPWVEELEAENEWLKRELKQTEVQDQVVIDGLSKENEKLKCLNLLLLEMRYTFKANAINNDRTKFNTWVAWFNKASEFHKTYIKVKKELKEGK